MKESQRVLLFITVIALISDLVEGMGVENEDELIDYLEILGFDSNEFLTLPPILAIHKICKEFGNMDITKQIIDEVMYGDSDD